jgi:excisionase family DNA binding protein
MFSIDLKFKIDGCEVPFERFTDTIVGEVLKAIRSETNRWPDRPSVEPREPQRKQDLEKKSYSLRESARLLGLSECTIRQYVAKNKIDHFRFGRRILIPATSLENIMREGVPSWHHDTRR